MHTNLSSGACARNHAAFFFFFFSSIKIAKASLRVDVVLVRVLISIRLDYSGSVTLVTRRARKHQKLGAAKWKLGGHETRITIKDNLCVTFCTSGKSICICVLMNLCRQRRVIFAFSRLICGQCCQFVSLRYYIRT